MGDRERLEGRLAYSRQVRVKGGVSLLMQQQAHASHGIILACMRMWHMAAMAKVSSEKVTSALHWAGVKQLRQVWMRAINSELGLRVARWRDRSQSHGRARELFRNEQMSMVLRASDALRSAVMQLIRTYAQSVKAGLGSRLEVWKAGAQMERITNMTKGQLLSQEVAAMASNLRLHWVAAKQLCQATIPNPRPEPEPEPMPTPLPMPASC